MAIEAAIASAAGFAAAGPAASRGSDPATVAVDRLTKTFLSQGNQQVTALSDVSLELREHEVLALLGPSGCGKSTLLNIIAGIAQPSAGTVYFRGVASDRFECWSEIGYIFQEDRLLPWRTAIRNVEFSLETGAMLRRDRRDRARFALALVGLAGFEDAYPHQLSGGMRSRVAIARSLVREPRILLMDEPFGRLDAQTREAMHRELLQIWEMTKTSIIFVTHDVAESVVLADRVVVFAPRPGRVRATVDIDLPRPRDTAAPEVVAYAQQLRELISLE